MKPLYCRFGIPQSCRSLANLHRYFMSGYLYFSSFLTFIASFLRLSIAARVYRTLSLSRGSSRAECSLSSFSYDALSVYIFVVSIFSSLVSAFLDLSVFKFFYHFSCLCNKPSDHRLFASLRIHKLVTTRASYFLFITCLFISSPQH